MKNDYQCISQFEIDCRNFTHFGHQNLAYHNIYYIIHRLSFCCHHIDIQINRVNEIALRMKGNPNVETGFISFSNELKFYFDFLLTSLTPVIEGSLNKDIKEQYSVDAIREHKQLRDQARSELEIVYSSLRNRIAHFIVDDSIVNNEGSIKSRKLIFSQVISFNLKKDKLSLFITNVDKDKDNSLDFFDTYNKLKNAIDKLSQYYINIILDSIIGESTNTMLDKYYNK